MESESVRGKWRQKSGEGKRSVGGVKRREEKIKKGKKNKRQKKKYMQRVDES